MNYEAPCIKLSQGYANLMFTALISTIFSYCNTKIRISEDWTNSSPFFSLIYFSKGDQYRMSLRFTLSRSSWIWNCLADQLKQLRFRIVTAMPFQCQFRLANSYGRAVMSISVSRRGGLVASFSVPVRTYACARFGSLWCSFLGVLVSDVQLIFLSNY